MTAEIHPPAQQFAQLFSSTRRGARLARLLALQQLADWGYPHSTPAAESAALIVAELTANAVTHGYVAGRDFALRLAHAPGYLWIEVSDAREESRPPLVPRRAEGEVDQGRGLLLVATLAARWGVTARPGGPGKTVWAELTLPTGDASAPRRQPT